jgi:hypothetical protein
MKITKGKKYCDIVSLKRHYVRPKDAVHKSEILRDKVIRKPRGRTFLDSVPLNALVLIPHYSQADESRKILLTGSGVPKLSMLFSNKNHFKNKSCPENS